MLHIRTPLILHPTLSTTTRRIWLKLENLQPSGSFKLRGMGLLCSQATAAGKRKVVCPGVSLAIAYLDHSAIADAHDVVIVVCGGVSISAQLVAGWAR